MRTVPYQIERINELQILPKKNQKKKNSGDEKYTNWNEKSERLSIGVEQAEERFSKLDDRSIEIIQSEEENERKKKDWGKMSRVSDTCKTPSSLSIYTEWES